MSETNGDAFYSAAFNALSTEKELMKENEAQTEKKPSYLNLACSVNGYSNLTTYDSKMRQDINKSREVSPIRPSSNTVQYCKHNSITPPVLHTIPSAAKLIKEDHGFSRERNFSEEPSVSFIQKTVESLYGSGALAQVIYSPKKSMNSSENCNAQHKFEEDFELVRRFNELNPSKDYSHLKRKLKIKSIDNIKTFQTNEDKVELPVFRHLSQEFRAQLPAISPKRGFLKSSSLKSSVDKERYESRPEVETSSEAKSVFYDVSNKDNDETDKVKSCKEEISNIYQAESKGIVNCQEMNNTECKKGEYFLQILKNETQRISSLADLAENYISLLSSNEEITDDVLGLLRSASGKARLLVSQKMKQFEGLCHNNLKNSSNEKFPTTDDDLQGFWDMVYLQVIHIDSIFKEIEVLKNKDWKKPSDNKNKISIKTPKVTKHESISKTKNSNTGRTPTSAAALKRDLQRQQLLEMKRKKRMEIDATQSAKNSDVSNNSSESFQIFISDNQMQK